MHDLLSLHDALQDFASCEYSLHTIAQVRIGEQTTSWQLLLSPPMFPGPAGKHAVLVQLSRWTSDPDPQEAGVQEKSDPTAASDAGATGSLVVRLLNVCEPDLLRIAQIYGL